LIRGTGEVKELRQVLIQQPLRGVVACATSALEAAEHRQKQSARERDWVSAALLEAMAYGT
jgi:hypothetical protein